MRTQLETRNFNMGGIQESKVRGRVAKRRSHNQVKKVEINSYLNKLQELIPCLPKDTKLSKLEVISNAIDYIHDLRQTLGLPPCSVDFDMESDGTETLGEFGNQTVSPNIKFQNISSSVSSTSSPVISQNAPVGLSKPAQLHRQPLGVIPHL
ncbi:Protein extra-macrochaetae [Orchesella cincta]|uniref:Protein extra-macrochaetae n=1 Tax=Orchesella cincta TaxID=48709 RepID=A0A1D2M5P6_ORCCI|nr:Protein extra-macrochaetae [Orchesella cincta]